MRIPPSLATAALGSVVSVLLAVPAESQASCELFGARLVAAGPSTRSLVLGDLEGDGDLDAFVSSFRLSVPSVSSITPLVNDGSGRFVAGSPVLSTPTLTGLAGGDLDGDGLADLVATIRASPTSASAVHVFRNVGGSFAAPVSYAGVYLYVYDPVLADVDLDGDLDLAGVRDALGGSNHGVDLRLNDGTGTFGAAMSVPMSEHVESLAFGDFDGDGDQDLTLGKYGPTGTLFTLLNQGGLSFQLSSSVPMGQVPRQILSVDLDGDAVRDRVVLDVNLRNVTTVRASGITTLHLDVPATPAMGAGDVDGDGDTDVLVCDGGVQILLNQAGVLAPGARIPTGAGPSAVLGGDIDQDGDLDVLTSDLDSGSVSVRENSGGGTFEGFHVLPGLNVYRHWFVDLDGDGLDEVLVESGVWQEAGGSWTQVETFAQPHSLGVFAVTDVNGDGLVDVVFGGASFPTIHVHFNLGGLQFSGPFSLLSGVTATSMAHGDVDGDGDADLAIGTNMGPSVALLLNSDGQGTFGPPQMLAVGIGRHALVFADVELDGDLDLVSANRSSNNLVVLANNGAGVFGAPATIASYGGQGPLLLRAADLDRDGDVDLAVGSETSRTVEILHNDGAGAFALAATLATGRAPRDLIFGRFDGDGAPDLALLDTSDGQPASAGAISVWLNAGDGLFALEGLHSYGSLFGFLGAVDADHDGFDELVMGGSPAQVFANGGACSTGIPYCFGDGSGAACPCGNTGAAGHGCESSAATGGGLLAARGAASVAQDTLVLDASGMPASTTALFFQGTTRENGGLGVFSGDGLLCTGGSLIRLGARTASGGASSFGYGIATDPPISVRGQVPAPGGTRTYQAWYRNAAVFCTSATYNLTNAVAIAWGS